MAWDRELPGCFGDVDKIFAEHPLDEERAFAWLRLLREQHQGWAEAKRQISEYLKSEGAAAAHIAKQIKRAEHRLRPWLRD